MRLVDRRSLLSGLASCSPIGPGSASRLNIVLVLDTVNKTIITTVDLGRNPEALALSANEEFLYVADYLTPTLTVLSLASSKRRPNRAG
jgi:DNA-binding beta-propeller fold protein YncE